VGSIVGGECLNKLVESQDAGDDLYGSMLVADSLAAGIMR